MRDENGRFTSGNNFGKGRPKGSGKKHIKEMTWDAMNRVVQLLFTMPDAELVQWVKDNGKDLSRAEKIFLNNKNVNKLEHLNSLLDRIIGKATYAQPDALNTDDDLDAALEALEIEEGKRKNGDVNSGRYDRGSGVDTRARNKTTKKKVSKKKVSKKQKTSKKQSTKKAVKRGVLPKGSSKKS